MNDRLPIPPRLPGTPRRSRSPAVRAETGSSSVEYVVTTLAVITALFLLPVNAEQQSAVEMLMDALRRFQQHSTHLLSLP